MLDLEESTAQGSRDARAFAATMDHADIRGLVTAFHLSVAGLPRSSVGDHHVDAHIARSRIPLIGARASRDPYVVGSMVVRMTGCSELLRSMDFSATGRSCGRLDLAGDVPDEGRELARDRHTDLVECKLAGRQMPVAPRQTQLRAPGDLAYRLGLTSLAPLQCLAHACRE